MILYFIQISTIWTFLLIAFYVFYRNQSYHRFNRFFIILSLVAGIVIPLIPNEFATIKISLLRSSYQSIHILDEIVVISTQHSTKNSLDILIIFTAFVYVCLVSVKLLKTIFELTVFAKLTKQRKKMDENTFILFTDVFNQPFSFINTIILPQAIENDSKTKEIIIAHEYTHIRYKHYLDLLFLKLLEILFPFHPCLHFFRKELILIHEYQADQEAIKLTNKERYSSILIQFAKNPKIRGSIIHTFYYSPIKNRIVMLFKKSSKLQYIYLALLPFLFMACTYLKQDADKSTSIEKDNNERSKHEIRNPLPNIIIGDSTITHSNAAMPDNNYAPHFPGGEKALLEFIGKNINYPEEGRKKGIHGTSFVKVEVYEDGTIHNKKILRSLGEEFDKELLQMMDLMPNWIPATNNDGKKMKESYTLPVKFSLEDKK